MRSVFIVFVMLTFGLCSFAQIRKTPAAVSQAFEKQYPHASKVQYEDNLLNIQVHFDSDSGRMTARYNSDGEWKESERKFEYDSLSPDVKSGFDKSKYAAEWKVKEPAILYLPNNEVRYRIKVEKNDVQKKYLFFDRNGRLIRDSLTI
jgi:hypothetical protein